MTVVDIFKKVINLFRRIRSRILTEFTIMYLYPAIYRKEAEAPFDESKVIFIESRLQKLSNSFGQIYNTLDKNTDFELKCHFLRKTYVSDTEYIKNCISLIKDMATAKYIFIDEATHIFAKITLREGSNLVQLWHGCGAFKKFGYSVSDSKFGASQRAKTRYPVHTNYSLATVSSEEVVRHFEEAMNIEKKGIVSPIGVSRTDIFYSSEFIKTSQRRLYELLPQAKEKKIILYAPTFRGNVESAAAPDKLDIDSRKDKLSDDYILIIKHHPLVKKRPDVSNSFSFDFTDIMSVDELLCVSDICISDYSSLVFEYSLFERPMIFFAYDLEEYFDSRGFYYDYNELTPGPVFKKTSEITDYILDINNRFNKNDVTSFREKFMNACDGNVTERIINKVFGDEYSRYKRK